MLVSVSAQIYNAKSYAKTVNVLNLDQLSTTGWSEREPTITNILDNCFEKCLGELTFKFLSRELILNSKT